MKWNELPKQFCDKTSCAYGDESVFVAMIAGSQGTAYALNPKHAKAFMKSLQYTIEKYEKQYGEIQSDWQPGVKSPLQLPEGPTGDTPQEK